MKKNQMIKAIKICLKKIKLTNISVICKTKSIITTPTKNCRERFFDIIYDTYHTLQIKFQIVYMVSK